MPRLKIELCHPLRYVDLLLGGIYVVSFPFAKAYQGSISGRTSLREILPNGGV